MGFFVFQEAALKQQKKDLTLAQEQQIQKVTNVSNILILQILPHRGLNNDVAILMAAGRRGESNSEKTSPVSHTTH